MARAATPSPDLGLGSLFAGGVATGAVTRDTSVRRGGLSSLRCDASGTSSPASAQWNAPFVLAQANFARVYLMVSVLPAGTIQIARFGGAAYPSVQLKPSGKLALFSPAGAQIGSDSTAAVTPGVWFMLELALTIGTGATDSAEARLNGTSIASTTAQTWSDTQPTALNAGWIQSGAGANAVIWISDVAINDASGATQNSWPGAGRVMVLRPASVSAQGAWTIGSGGSIPTALSAVPPAGVADASTATSQARSVSATANETLSVVTETYDSRIPTSATLTLVQPWADHAEGAGAGTKNLDLAVSANPAGSTSSVFAAGGDAGAAGAWPSNWRGTFGPPVATPTPTRSTGATLTIRDATTNTNAVEVDSMALIVEYTYTGGNIDRSGSAVLNETASGGRTALRDRSGRSVLAGAASGARSALRDRSGRSVLAAAASGSRSTLRARTGAAVLGLYAAGSQTVDHTGPPPPEPTGTGAGGTTWTPSFLEKRTGALVDRSGAAILALHAAGRGRVEQADPDVEALLLAGVL